MGPSMRSPSSQFVRDGPRPTVVRKTVAMHRSPDPADDQRIVRALLLLQSYSTAITRIAVETLVGGEGANREIGLLLSLHFDGPQAPSELAESLGLDRSQTSRMLRRLDAAGLVTRDPHPEDGRRTTVRLTARGHRRLASFDEALAAYSLEAEPMVAEMLDLVRPEPSAGDPPPRSALEAAVQMSAVGEEFVEKAVAALAPYGVTEDRGERFVLGLLLAHGPQRPGLLSEALKSSPAYTSARLRRLEAAGLVTRRLEGGSDGRAVLAELTPTGHRAARTYLAVFAEEAPRVGAAVAGIRDAMAATGAAGRSG